jgi:transcriptional regulator GlxA family with amidase domain
MPKDPRFPPKARIVELLVYPAVQLLDVAGPLQVFSSANDVVADAGGAPPYALKVVARAAGACRPRPDSG